MLEFKKEQYYKNQLLKLNKICNIFSVIRGIVAFTFLICTLYMFSNIMLITIIISTISFIIMISLFLYSNRYYKKTSIIKNILQCYKIHYYRRNYEFNALIDDGYDLLSKNNYMISDLDILGKKSLFQFITQCKTKLGRIKLKDRLINNKSTNRSYSEAIIELGNNEDILLLEAAINLLDCEERKFDSTNFNSLEKINIKPFKKILNLLANLISYIIIILFFIKIVELPILIISLILNILTSLMLINNIFKLNSIQHLNVCEKYLNIIEIIENLKFENELLKELKDSILNSNSDLLQYKNIFVKLSYRKNFIIKILLNIIIPFDLLLIETNNKIINNIKSIEDIFDNISNLEVLLSFSNIIKDTNVYSIGNISDSINIEEMVHPLLPNCVSNNFSMLGGVILTGSNMSGKTTFMRTLGINQVLFNACGITCSKSYFGPNLTVFTSLRTYDELSEGVSTFYAEILRMKLINSNINDKQCLILIDEIFKGTNAKDRIYASLQVIDKLNSHNQYFIISTHDEEICNADNIKNHHFIEKYVDNKIIFDYKIKDGKCNSKNAIYLLKISNIIS